MKIKCSEKRSRYFWYYI